MAPIAMHTMCLFAKQLLQMITPNIFPRLVLFIFIYQFKENIQLIIGLLLIEFLILYLENMSSNKFQPLAQNENEDIEEAKQSSVYAENTSNMTKESKKIEKYEVFIPTDEHRLQSTYCLWYSRKATKIISRNTSLVATFATVEQFWRIYSHLSRPNTLHSGAELHVFKEGIKPMWEDDANKQGGRWIVHLRKELANRCWENLLMAMLGEQFMVGEEICGAMVSIRYNEDIISLWNRTTEEGVTNRIRNTFRRVLNLPPATIIQYQKFW